MKNLQLTPLRIECITSLVSSSSSLDIFSRERPTAADTSNIARLRDNKFQNKYNKTMVVSIEKLQV